MPSDPTLGDVLGRWLLGVSQGLALDPELDREARQRLARWVGGAISSNDRAELADIADEALVRALEAVRDGRLDVTRADAPGYVLTTARNVALDRLRKGVPEPHDLSAVPALPTEGTDDQAIAALLDRTADVHRVTVAMKRAIEAGDLETVRVVATWLDLASRSGEKPSTRVVGELVHLSHTAVRNHLDRFRWYLAEAQDEDN